MNLPGNDLRHFFADLSERDKSFTLHHFDLWIQYHLRLNWTGVSVSVELRAQESRKSKMLLALPKGHLMP